MEFLKSVTLSWLCKAREKSGTRWLREETCQNVEHTLLRTLLSVTDRCDLTDKTQQVF